MKPIDVSVTVEESPETVFAFISDFENNSSWQSGIETARFTSDGPLEVGSTYRQTDRSSGGPSKPSSR